MSVESRISWHESIYLKRPSDFPIDEYYKTIVFCWIEEMALKLSNFKKLPEWAQRKLSVSLFENKHSLPHYFGILSMARIAYP